MAEDWHTIIHSEGHFLMEKPVFFQFVFSQLNSQFSFCCYLQEKISISLGIWSRAEFLEEYNTNLHLHPSIPKLDI